MILFLGLVSGCATVREKKDYLMTDLPEPERQGVYHKVKRGQTLWRIAGIYNVAIADIIRTNRIPNVAQIEENQLIFIPGADAGRDPAADPADGQSGFIWPVKGKVVKYFHERDNAYVNKGIEISAREGEFVKASRGGRVVFADYLGGYGHTVILDHADEIFSVYARNAKLLVKLNETVRQGDKIAQLGGAGAAAYVHFEIRKNSVEDNPLYYLP